MLVATVSQNFWCAQFPGDMLLNMERGTDVPVRS